MHGRIDRFRRWWAFTLFPAAAPVSCPGPRAAECGLLVAACLLFFCRLNCPLLEPEEVRYAEIPRQMLAEGRWLVPVLHGQAYLDKPPLFYWLVMASYSAFGVHDWAARAVPALAAVLTVLVALAWGRRTVGARTALAGAAVLCLAPEFIYRGRMLTMNGVLALFTTTSLAAGHLALIEGRLRWGWWLTAAVVCGLGVLTKGPVAVALVVPVLFAAAWLDPRLARPGVVGWAGWLVGVAAVAGPWFVAVAAREPGFAEYFVWTHHVRRYVDTIDHAEPVWFYLPGLIAGMMPGTLLLLPLVRLLRQRTPLAARRRPAGLGVFVLAGGWAVLFFSAADCKRAVYLIPALPPLALALGCGLDATMPRPFPRALWRWRTPLAQRIAGLMLAVGLVGGLAAVWSEFGSPSRLAAMIGLTGIALVIVLSRRRLAWGAAALITFGVLLAGTHDLLPGYHQRFSLRRTVQEQAIHAADVAVFCYPRRWDSVSYYLGRNDVQSFGPDRLPALIGELRGERRSLLFVKTRHLAELLAALPPTLEFVPLRQTPWVTAGHVRLRRDAPHTMLAARQ